MSCVACGNGGGLMAPVATLGDVDLWAHIECVRHAERLLRDGTVGQPLKAV